MKTLTMHKLLLPLAAGILFTLCSPSWADYIFSENFNGYTNGNQNALQVDTGLLVSFGGTLPGWQKAGAGAIHAVNQDGAGDYACMFWQDNVITLADGIAANDTGTAYGVAFLAGPAVYANRSQTTTAGDGLVVDVLRTNNTVLATYTFNPGAWAGTETLAPASFVYVGDGSGPVRLRVSPLLVGDGHFSGAIDNLTVTNFGAATAPTITTQPVGGTVIAGSDFTFSVAATGATSYQWRKNGTAISGATNSSYMLSDVATNDAGTYSVRVANPVAGVLSSNAVLSVAPAPTYATYQSAVLADQPIHYYPLQDTNGTLAADLGSSATTGGTYTGGFTLGQPTGAPSLGFGRCVLFDGQPGTYVDVGLFHPGDSVTAEAWVNLDPTAHAGPYYDIVGRANSYVLDFAPGDAAQFAAWTGSGVAAAITTSSLSRGQWHHLVGEFDGVAGTSTVWVDGVQGPVVAGSGLANAGPTPDRVLIAGSRDGTNASFNFKGLIAQVAIYSNALSTAQIRAHFRTAVPSAPPLSIQSAVILSWPSLPPGYVLQSASTVTGPYSNYQGSIYPQGNNFIAPVPLGTTDGFFRLSGRAP